MHRKIYENIFGEIPKDENGRTFETHHIDGNRKNNSIDNLLCVSIKEHLEIHLKQGDYGAAALISKRMGLPINFMSEIQKGTKRPGIGGVKKGTIPWNKNRKGVFNHSTSTKCKLSEYSTGENNSRSILTEQDVVNIIKHYISNPILEGVGLKHKNGVKKTYNQIFCEKSAEIYKVSVATIRKIINKETWRYVWKKYDL